MLIDYKKMFCMISEMARIHNKYIPLPSHEDNQKKWFIQLHNSLDTLYLSVSSEEKEKLQKIETVFYSMYEQFLKYSTLVRSKEEIKTAVTTIFNKDQVEQRSEQWYDDMKQMITASEFSKLFDSERTRALMVFSKLQEPEKRNIVLAKPTDFLTAMDWGVRFEPLVRNYLETLWNCKIYESGRLKHPTNTKLGASPDGIVVEPEDSDKYGRLVEIKCPYSREVGKKVPFEYWCQMQIQMEVTGIEECEYVEVKIDSISPKKADLSGSTPDGYLWLFQNSTTCQMSYAYTEAEKDESSKNGLDLIETIPWRLAKFYSKTVTRDRAWFEGTAKLREDFWSIVGQARRGEIQPFEVKSRSKVIVTKEPECRIVDDI